MKKIIFMFMLAGATLAANRTQAQVNVNINIGNQPAWAPEGYDDAQYYYIPDMDVYYDVPAHQFLYLSNQRWVRTATLPAAYRRYDLYKVHKVAINGKEAYRNHSRDQQQYAQFRGKYDQQPIRDGHNDKYAANRNNWNNNRFAGGNGHDKQNRQHNDQNHHHNNR